MNKLLLLLLLSNLKAGLHIKVSVITVIGILHTSTFYSKGFVQAMFERSDSVLSRELRIFSREAKFSFVFIQLVPDGSS